MIAAYIIFLKFAWRQSKFRIIVTVLSVLLASLILLSTIALGQGWLARYQKASFIDALSMIGSSVSHRDTDETTVYLSLYDTEFQSQPIKEVGVLTVDQAVGLPGGLQVPPRDQMWVTPALKQRIDSSQLLRERYQQYEIKSEFPEELAPSPNSLMVLFRISENALGGRDTGVRATDTDSLWHVYSEQQTKNQTQLRLLRLALLIVGILLILPVMMLLAEVARIGISEREERYAAMSLTGITTKELYMIAIFETLPLAIAGVALGGLLFAWLGDLVLSQFLIAGANFWRSDMLLASWLYALACSTVVLCVVVTNLQAVRRIRLSPLVILRAKGTVKHVSVLTLAPLLLGVGTLFFMAQHGQGWYVENVSLGGIVLAVALVTVIVGIFVGGPHMTYIASFIVRKVFFHSAGVLAAYRLRYTARSAFRSVSGIVIALFVGTIFVTFLANMQAAETQQDRVVRAATTSPFVLPMQIDITESGAQDMDAALIGRLKNNKRLMMNIERSYTQSTFQGEGDVENRVQGNYYESCDELQQRTQIHCSHDMAGPLVVSLQFISDARGSMRLQPQITSLNGMKGAIYTNRYTVVSKDTASFEQTVNIVGNIVSNYQRATGRVVAIAQGDTPHVAGSVNTFGGLVMTLLAVTIIIGGLSIFVSVVGSIFERRRVFAQLRVVGASLGTLAGSLYLEIIAPLVVMAGVATGLGVFCCYCLLAIIGVFSAESTTVFYTPELSFWLVLVGTILVCASISLIAVPILAHSTRTVDRVE